ncbi:aspartate kinase [Helicobacter sp. MIT 21-1697]|uniref:aspartate kinase n=1 Tax=Helicobacter sp. MIT 21-1697 TaxID=2993733 RepID=UPI00224B03F7|nr:aspartate kinase [Helicobacter sp. MIT 21-1697]MCX2716246.1 aspartate kinase [Helicobacter sp. MIT 21-1697]
MLIVQKYGGTSMGDCDRIHNVAKRVIKSKAQGHSLVVVVSAMGGETDRLINLTQHFTPLPNTREVDMVLSAGERVSAALLAIALESMGIKAISLSGRGAGIITDEFHTKARISYVDTTKIFHLLNEDYVVVVAGFQGISQQGEVTTLGRGGSDLSAVALAGALNAAVCEIYSDVDGIYTTDPRIVKNARKLEKISYDEMLELASMGAKVLLNRSVELAKKLNVNLICASSFNESQGTLITQEEDIMEKPIVSGVALDKNQARVSLADVQDRPGIAADIFGLLADNNINVDMIVQTIGRDGKTDIDFTIPKTEVAFTQQVLEKFKDDLGNIDYDNNIAKVSIVGVGMKSHSGVASTAFKALAQDDINIMMISTSEIKISMIINAQFAELAVCKLHSVYELDK